MGGDVRAWSVRDQLDHRGEGLREHDGHAEDQGLQTAALHAQDHHRHQADQGEDGEAAERRQVAGALLQPTGPGQDVRMAGNAERKQHHPVEPAGVLVLHSIPEPGEGPDRARKRQRGQQQPALDAPDGDDRLRRKCRVGGYLGHSP